jgi:hypothetical protein
MEELAGMVAARCPYRADERLLRRTGMPSRIPSGVDEMSALIAGMDDHGKGVPILIKQYLKTGGRLLAFNVDRAFSDALDALILVDLRNPPPTLLDCYMGSPAARAFFQWHRLTRGAA